MRTKNKLVFAACLFWGAHTLAYAQPTPRETRGELLYTEHCSACHTTKVHWREQRIATDWSSLIAEVRRWQASIGLNWTEGEITDVALYLNAVYYGFPVAGKKPFLPDKKLSEK